MGRIIATEHISLDGVVEAPGPGDIGDFRHKGWIFDFDREEGRDRYKLDEVLAAEALLLGRVTYETMAAYWPEVDGRFADRLNAMPKYVFSSDARARGLGQLDDPARRPRARSRACARPSRATSSSTAASSSPAACSSTACSTSCGCWSIRSRCGSGMSLFGSSPDKLPLRLVDSRTFDGGVVLLSYAPEAPSSPA